MPMKKFTHDIWVRDTNGIKRKVARFDINHSKDGLGLHVNPDGSMESQLEFLTKKIDAWTTKLKRSSLSRHHTYIAAKTRILRTLIYSLPGCMFSIKQCRSIEFSLYKVLMPKMGVSYTIPLPYRYGSAQYQGLSLLHLHSQMMIEQLKIFLMSYHTQY